MGVVGWAAQIQDSVTERRPAWRFGAVRSERELMLVGPAEIADEQLGSRGDLLLEHDGCPWTRRSSGDHIHDRGGAGYREHGGRGEGDSEPHRYVATDSRRARPPAQAVDPHTTTVTCPRRRPEACCSSLVAAHRAPHPAPAQCGNAPVAAPSPPAHHSQTRPGPADHDLLRSGAACSGGKIVEERRTRLWCLRPVKLTKREGRQKRWVQQRGRGTFEVVCPHQYASILAARGGRRVPPDVRPETPTPRPQPAPGTAGRSSTASA